MTEIIKNKISFITAIVGFIGGVAWFILSKFDLEPLILVFVSIIEIIGYFLVADEKDETMTNQNKNDQTVSVNVNIGASAETATTKTEGHVPLDRGTIIDFMRTRTSILFIDDDKKFNVVNILKGSGWRKTKTVIDIKTLEVPVVKNADIIFVDINGVGKLLNLQYEGLDLALMLKQKYPEKKVIIYSANRNSNSFHEAWDICDFKLEKNALPYQFQNLVEVYSEQLYNARK